jgi:hypothetical protein
MMNSFHVVAIPTEVADAVRSTHKDPRYKFPAHKEVAAGRAPCRHCLRLIHINSEELLLFTHDPFEELGEPPLPGPVYIHAEKCLRRTDQDSIPEEYRGRLLTFDAYGNGRELLREVRLMGGGEDDVARNLFAGAAVKYIHVRSTEAGCYLFRLERGAEAISR